VGVFFFIIIQPNPIKLGEKIRMAHAWSNFFSFLCDLENLCFYGFFLCLLRSFRFGFWFWVWCSCWVQQVEGRHVDRRSVLSFAVWNSNTLAYDVFIGSGKYIFCVFFKTLFDMFQWGGFDFGFCWVIGFNCRRCFLRVTPPRRGRFRLKLAGKYN